MVCRVKSSTTPYKNENSQPSAFSVFFRIINDNYITGSGFEDEPPVAFLNRLRTVTDLLNMAFDVHRELITIHYSLLLGFIVIS